MSAKMDLRSKVDALKLLGQFHGLFTEKGSTQEVVVKIYGGSDLRDDV